MFSPGTPKILTTADTAYQLSTVHKLVKSIIIQPSANNQGILYIGDSTLVPSLNTGIARQIPKPAPDKIEAFELKENDVPNGIDLYEFFCSSTVDGDIVFWSWNEQ